MPSSPDEAYIGIGQNTLTSQMSSSRSTWPVPCLQAPMHHLYWERLTNPPVSGKQPEGNGKVGTPQLMIKLTFGQHSHSFTLLESYCRRLALEYALSLISLGVCEDRAVCSGFDDCISLLLLLLSFACYSCLKICGGWILSIWRRALMSLIRGFSKLVLLYLCLLLLSLRLTYCMSCEHLIVDFTLKWNYSSLKMELPTLSTGTQGRCCSKSINNPIDITALYRGNTLGLNINIYITTLI